MKWEKKGLIFNAAGQAWWMQSHAMVPTPIIKDSNTVRFYTTFCDNNGIGRIGYVDTDSHDFSKVISFSREPLIDIGKLGTFDENGVMACSIVRKSATEFFLYYAGFELGTKIRYRLLTGLAVSTDSGETFTKYQQTPILERSSKELFFRCGPYCFIEKNIFHLYYVAGSDWIEINKKMMPVYTINYLQSNDGIHWDNEGRVCIDIQHENEHGFGRPYVIKHDGIYKMFYSIRIKNKGYRLGYAESMDKENWIRMDDKIGIDVSDSGWDSQAICYPAVLPIHDRIYMFYNGNEFGKTGFGYAQLGY